MRSIRKLALVGCAALVLCAAVASSASAALTAVDKATNVPLAVGTGVTGTTTGASTLSGTLLGANITITCSHSTLAGTLDNNSGGVVSGRITNVQWFNCASSTEGSCSISAVGLPWDMTDGGGLQALSTTSVAVSPGTNGSVDLTNCMPFGVVCTITGNTASIGSTPLEEAVQFSWNNANSEMSVSGLNKLKAKNCAAGSNLTWTATYQLFVTGSPTTLVGINP